MRRRGRPSSDGLARLVREVARSLGGERTGPSLVRLKSGLEIRCVYRSSQRQTGAALVRLLERTNGTGKVHAVVLNDRFVVCALGDWTDVSAELVLWQKRGYVIGQSIQVKHAARPSGYLEDWLSPDSPNGSAVAVRVKHRRTIAMAYRLQGFGG